MSSTQLVRTRLKRAKGLLVTLLRNKMAAVGLVILVLFSTAALAAPVLTPYDPQRTSVSSRFAAPVWVRYLPGGEGFSENIDFGTLQVSTSSSAIEIEKSSEHSATITVDRQVSNPGDLKASLRKSLHYPFEGPAGQFLGNIAVKAEGINQSSPLGVKLYLAGSLRPGVPWLLWEDSIEAASATVQPDVSLNSNNELLKRHLELDQFVGDPAALVFGSVGDFEYVLELTFSPTAISSITTVSVESFRMRVYGTAFGALGTNHLGLDVFTQLAYGARVSLAVGILASLIGVIIGLLVGLMAGYLGRLVDETLMRFTDMILVLPGLPLLLVLQAILGRSFWILIGILGLLSWEGFARVIRSQVLSLKERPFVESAKAAGAGTFYIVGRHIFPNLVALTYIALATAVPGAILAESALSFLGFFDPTVISWGRVINEAFVSSGSSLAKYWWWVLPPGISIAIVALSFILIGYSLDEIFNPKLRKRR